MTKKNKHSHSKYFAFTIFHILDKLNLLIGEAETYQSIIYNSNNSKNPTSVTHTIILLLSTLSLKFRLILPLPLIIFPITAEIDTLNQYKNLNKPTQFH